MAKARAANAAGLRVASAPLLVGAAVVVAAGEDCPPCPPPVLCGPAVSPVLDGEVARVLLAEPDAGPAVAPLAPVVPDPAEAWLPTEEPTELS